MTNNKSDHGQANTRRCLQPPHRDGSRVDPATILRSYSANRISMLSVSRPIVSDVEKLWVMLTRPVPAGIKASLDRIPARCKRKNIAASAAWHTPAAAPSRGVSLVAQALARHAFAANRVLPRARSLGRAPVVRQGGFRYRQRGGHGDDARVEGSVRAVASSTTAAARQAGIAGLPTGGSVRLRRAALAPSATDASGSG